MTVCIAAVCNESKNIVMASDFKISSELGLSSDNVALKTVAIAKGWWGLFAGNDLSPVPSIVRSVRKELINAEGEDIDDVKKAFARAYQAEMNSRAEREVLSPWNITLDRFINEGVKIFKNDFSSINARISEIKLECDFLVCGFDRSRSASGTFIPHIFTVSGEYHGYATGVCIRERDNPQFFAIGSGSLGAMSMLFFFGQNILTSIPQTIYSVAAGKFMGERGEGVGDTTLLHVIDPSTSYEIDIGSETLRFIREFWDKQGAPRILPEMVDHLDRLLRQVFGEIQQQAKQQSG